MTENDFKSPSNKEDEVKKMRLTERERKEIKKEVRAEFKKKIEELEANILAYQDLLMTKDAEISQLAERLRQSASGTDLEKIFIEEFKKQINDLECQIAVVKNKETDIGCDVKKDEGIREGNCTQDKLTLYVYKRIEDLNNDWEKRSRQIHDQYEKAMKEFTEKYLTEIEEKNAYIKKIRKETGYEWEQKVYNLQQHSTRLEGLKDTLDQENEAQRTEMEAYKEKIRELIKDQKQLKARLASNDSEYRVNIKLLKEAHDGDLLNYTRDHERELFELRGIKEAYDLMIKGVDQGLLDLLKHAELQRDDAKFALAEIKAMTNEKLTEANKKIRKMRTLIIKLKADLKSHTFGDGERAKYEEEIKRMSSEHKEVTASIATIRDEERLRVEISRREF
jgi:chromosome segregation ATPase